LRIERYPQKKIIRPGTDIKEIHMRRLSKMLPPAAATIILSACGGYYHGNGPGYGYSNGPGNGYLPLPGPQSLLEVMHASPDAPPVNVLFDGNLVYSNLDYPQGTGQTPVDATVSQLTAARRLDTGQSARRAGCGRRPRGQRHSERQHRKSAGAELDVPEFHRVPV
jgi:hypothetical protein